MKISSFGCSITFGTELSDVAQDLPDQPFQSGSQFTWPALVASRLQYQYSCRAQGGSGNLCIMDRAVRSSFLDAGNSLSIINWTLIDRFDYSNPFGPHYNNGGLDYLTLRPMDTDDTTVYYFKNLQSEYRDKLTALMYIKTTIDILRKNNRKFVMTCVDDLLFCTKWHAPHHVLELQQEIRPYIHDFEGKNFLAWSRDRGFKITAAGHPLEAAHAAAADIMLPVIESILHKA